MKRRSFLARLVGVPLAAAALGKLAGPTPEVVDSVQVRPKTCRLIGGIGPHDCVIGLDERVEPEDVLWCSRTGEQMKVIVPRGAAVFVTRGFRGGNPKAMLDGETLHWTRKVT